jgi:acyl-CoA synthetase (NDP forming)
MTAAALIDDTPHKSRLARLLAPRSIAFIGGRIAEMAIARCLEAGFDGEIYAVHHSRDSLSGYRCYPSVADLPVVPDAAYVGVNREATIDVVQSLSARGVGGCVCYAAGFSEVGDDGRRLQERLVAAAGSMPLVGPNCYGFINYVDHCALWPYLYGGETVRQGVALISQSGNIAMNLTMNERSVRFTHVICAGNQAVLGPGDYLEALLEDSRVRAIGMYLEGVDDVDAFARMARRALEKGVPIVVMKVGRTQSGAQRASSHTSSLTGSDVLYDAYFARLGIIRVDSLNRLLEVLKIFDVGGSIGGRDIVTLSCSGGEAAILADLCAVYGLGTPAFSKDQTRALHELFPGYVTVSNPFDYNTSIWGDREAMQRCFTASMSGAHDAAILVYDHPTVEADEVTEWIEALDAFVAAHAATGMRAFVASTLPELLLRRLRERLIEAGVTPLQGLDDALFALAAAAAYEAGRAASGARALPRRASPTRSDLGSVRTLDEWESKSRLAAFGLKVPEGRLVGQKELPEAAARVGFPVALKACGASFAHKSELGAVRLGLHDAEAVRLAAESIRAAAHSRGLVVESFLVEHMIDGAVAELIVGIHRDEQFGPTLVIGSGGILVELVGDTASLLLPTDRDSIERALMQLKVAALLRGFRGRPAGDIAAAIEAIATLARFAESHWDTLQELDVNPLIVLPQGHGIVAVDALLRVCESI